MQAAQECLQGRPADAGRREGMSERCSLLGQTIEIGRQDDRTAHETRIVVGMIIAQNEDDIGRPLREVVTERR